MGENGRGLRVGENGRGLRVGENGRGLRVGENDPKGGSPLPFSKGGREW